MKFSASAIPLLIALATATLACRGDGAPADSLDATGVEYEEFVSQRANYRIDVPSEWVIIEDFTTQSAGQTLLADAFGPEPTSQTDFAANVNVLSLPAAFPTFEQEMEFARAGAEAEFGDFEERDLVVAGTKAKLFKGSSDDGTTASLVLLVVGETTWVLTLLTASPEHDMFVSVFEHMYGSFRPQ